MRKLIWLIIIIAAVVGLTFALGPRQANGPGEEYRSPDQQSVVAENDYIRYPGRDGWTAFELLRENAEVEFQQFDFGVFVSGINGIRPPDGAFWKLMINGQDAQVGADQLETRGGDVIEWKIEEIIN